MYKNLISMKFTTTGRDQYLKVIYVNQTIGICRANNNMSTYNKGIH